MSFVLIEVFPTLLHYLKVIDIILLHVQSLVWSHNTVIATKHSLGKMPVLC